MITLFFTARQLIRLEVPPKGSKLNQQYFIDYVFPDLKTENWNFPRGMPHAIFWVHTDNSMCHNGSKGVSKFDKHHIVALTLFARLEPARLLALRDVERNPEGSRVSFA
jgi:hypothetical protein